MTLTIFSASGQKLASYETTAGTLETRIDVSQMRAGLYLVEVRKQEEQFMLRFIKE